MFIGIFIVRTNRCIGAREAGTDNTREDVKCDLQMVYEETFDMEEREKVLSRQTVFLYRK